MPQASRTRPRMKVSWGSRLKDRVGGFAMRWIALVLTAAVFAAQPATAGDKDQAGKKDTAAIERAFKEYGDFAVGGVWTIPGEKGGGRDFRVEWILGKSFLLTTETWGDHGSVSISGIDPATGLWKDWGFTSRGAAGTAIVERVGPGSWSFREELREKGVKGPDGYTLTKVAGDKIHVEG